ncbi:unnamed protein product [Musa textilis]
MLAAATKKKLGLLALSRYVLLPRVSPPPRHREPQRLRPASATTLRCLYRPPPPVRSKIFADFIRDHWTFAFWIRMSHVQSISSPNRGLLIRPDARHGIKFPPLSRALYSNATYLYASPSVEFCQHKVFPRLIHNARKSGRCAPVYASGRKGDSRSENEPFSWETLKKAVGGFSFRRELTVQDMLRERAQERQFDGNGGDGISGGGGGGDGSGGPEDEGFAGQFDELVQVIMAVIVVVLLYVLMISGEEVTRLVRDYIKYLFGAKPSVRLTRAMKKWRKFYRSVARKGVVREDWLEREIVLTPTWWHKPRWLAFVVRTYYERYGNQNH